MDGTRLGWWEGVTESFPRMIGGGLLFLAAFPLIFKNEGCAAREYNTLHEAKGAVVSVGDAGKIDPALEGKLVHATGKAETAETLKDEAFPIEAQAVMLRRKVQMYQWVERKETEERKEEKDGPRRKVDVYYYDKTWSSKEIDSGKFHEPGHVNPTPMPYKSKRWTAEKVTLGAYTLPTSLVNTIQNFETLPMATEDLIEAQNAGKLQGFLSHGGGLYFGLHPEEPAIGDLKASWELAPATTVSVLAKQRGSTWESYLTRAGGEMMMLSVGSFTAEQMIGGRESAVVVRTWFLRGIGFFMMLAGGVMLGSPLAALFDFLPFLGKLAQGGVTLAALAAAGFCSLITIAAAWVFYRPWLALGMVACGVLVLGGAAWWVTQRLNRRQAA